MLPQSVIKKLEECYGKKINSADCEVMKMSFQKRLHERIGISTIKRWCGLVKNHDRNNRDSTREILAHYCGYQSYDALLAEVGNYDYRISNYDKIDDLYSDELDHGAKVKLAWQPGCELVMTYLGDKKYHVDSVVGSKKILP